jgi:pantetheine-phosphate adenylyltransferase
VGWFFGLPPIGEIVVTTNTDRHLEIGTHLAGLDAPGELCNLRRMSTLVPHVRRAVFPGQFDPITNGHLDVIHRGLKLFDEIIVAVGINPEKRGLFTLEEREEMIRHLLDAIPNTRVMKYSGLTADFVQDVKATAILRGIRDVSDLRYEFQLALANRAVGGIETVFVMTGDNYALTSSSLIRQVVALGGDLRTLASVLPQIVIDRLRDKQLMGKRFRPPPPDAPAT